MKARIDSHIHLDHKRYDEDRESIISRFSSDGVVACVNPGSDLDSSKKALLLAQTHPAIFAAVGTHPHEARFFTDETQKAYREMAKEEKVVAIGEIGLDYHYDFSPRDVQRAAFERQLAMALELDLPVVIHCREAAEDTYAVMQNFGKRIRAVMHSFNEGGKWAQKFAAFGYSFSIGGMITFPGGKKVRELAEAVPVERLFVETDGPYLTPVPHRGKRNLPEYTSYVIERLAGFLGMEEEACYRVMFQNAKAFFDLPVEDPYG